MSSDDASFAAELLEDFYAECDEHLAAIRQQLLALDVAPDASAAASHLDSAYRSMHSFKGNAAIVGLRPAEELAHAAEGLLRSLLRREVAGTRESSEVLSGALLRLEEIVGAHRQKQPLPDHRALVTALEAQLGTTGGTPVAANASATGGPPPAASGNVTTWRCVFRPSRELDQRGININTVRARLTAIGNILSAVPSVQPNAGIQFEFAVAVREPAPDVTAWLADGIEMEPAPVMPAVNLDAPSAATTPGNASGTFMAPSPVVRVDLGRLDDLMRITGEMVILRSRLEERISRASGETSSLQEVSGAIARSLRELREALTRVRLVPIAEIFTRLPFVVRDLGRTSGKHVQLVVEGQQTEIDKYLVERLREPLLHLVRNCVTHGVESPAERATAGKSAEATVVVRAAASGHAVSIEVRDDGRGVDVDAVIARAKAARLPIPNPLDEVALLDLLCHPGLSTRDEADLAAGRGVGMAVVRSTVRELGGTLSLESHSGRGTTFTLRLPLTLSIAETFILSAAEHTCAVPQEFVQEVLSLVPDQVHAIHDIEVLPYRDTVLPLLRLRTFFAAAAGRPPHATVLVLQTERGLLGLVADRVWGRREVVVRALQDPLIRVPGISGATELGDGRPILILDPTALGARLGRSLARYHAAAPARN